MKLFPRKKQASGPVPPPARPAPVPPPLPARKPETVLKLNLPNLFAFQEDATKAKVAARPSPAQPGESARPGGRGSVVLVESDDEVRRLMSRLLQYEGYQLRTVSCLAEARDLLHQAPSQYVLARRACVPLNLQTEIALREIRDQASVRVVDDFSELILGQVVDYESMAQCTAALSLLLLSLLEGANPNARGHAHTVGKYARLVGQRLGLQRRDLDALSLAATVHDLGALETRRDLSAPSFAGTEFQSPCLGATLDLLANVPFPYEINTLLAATTDAGHGPSGPDDDLPAVPLGARILRVVDTYDTLRRQQSELFPTEDKLFEWMRQQPAGTFDADALETLIHIRKHERAINAMNLFSATVLCVDPHPEELGLLRLRLENDDYQVLLARTQAEALQQLRTRNIALVLTEYQLDQPAGGFELLRGLKTDPALRHVPVILQAAPETDRIKQALELGAEDWFAKPVNVEIAALKTIRILNRLQTAPAAKDGVQGNLRDLGLVEMVQILCGGGRSVRISLQNGERQAELAIVNGRLHSARLGPLSGEPAALQILGWQEGSFALRPLREAPEPNIHVSTDNLLLQGCLATDHRNANSPHGAAVP